MQRRSSSSSVGHAAERSIIQRPSIMQQYVGAAPAPGAQDDGAASASSSQSVRLADPQALKAPSILDNLPPSSAAGGHGAVGRPGAGQGRIPPPPPAPPPLPTRPLPRALPEPQQLGMHGSGAQAAELEGRAAVLSSIRSANKGGLRHVHRPSMLPLPQPPGGGVSSMPQFGEGANTGPAPVVQDSRTLLLQQIAGGQRPALRHVHRASAAPQRPA
jgi:hypothetical protein